MVAVVSPARGFFLAVPWVSRTKKRCGRRCPPLSACIWRGGSQSSPRLRAPPRRPRVCAGWGQKPQPAPAAFNIRRAGMPAARSAATLSKGGKVWRPARRKGQAMRWRVARWGLPLARCKHCIRKTCARWAAPSPPLAGKCLQEGGTPPTPPLKGGKNGTHPRSLSLRTSPQAGVAIRNTLTPHPCHMGNGFPRRCAPRNDIFTKTILSCVGAGFYPARLHAAERENGRGRAVAPTHVLQISL